jgi:hypothetical protein
LIIPFLTHCSTTCDSVLSCLESKPHEEYRVIEDTAAKQTDEVKEWWTKENEAEKKQKKKQKTQERKPDIESIPANLSDYYVYDSEKGDWVWSEKMPPRKSKAKKTISPKVKKPVKGVTSPTPTPTEEPVSWVIFARGVDKAELKKRFPNLEKKYEICRFNRKEMRLDCASK